MYLVALVILSEGSHTSGGSTCSHATALFLLLLIKMRKQKWERMFSNPAVSYLCSFPNFSLRERGGFGKGERERAESCNKQVNLEEAVGDWG